MAASLGFATGPALGGVLLQQCWLVMSGIGLVGALLAYLAAVEKAGVGHQP